MREGGGRKWQGRGREADDWERGKGMRGIWEGEQTTEKGEGERQKGLWLLQRALGK